jgi:acyl transferase domain-containing protein
MTGGGPLDIAIVGLGYCSGTAPDLFQYWENVLAGRTRHERWQAAR